jgi:hypothetical protein
MEKIIKEMKNNLKGALHKTENGWVVKWIDQLHGFGGAGFKPLEAELHPDSQKLKKLTEGKEVEFELVNKSNYFDPYNFDQTAKLLLKKPNKPTTKDCERFVCEWVWDFVYKNWDKIDTKKCDITQSKEQFLKEVKKDVQTAMWVLSEVMNWGMDKNYTKELFPTIYEPDDYEFRVIQLNGRYIKIVYNKDYTYTVSFVEPKTKTVIYFD